MDSINELNLWLQIKERMIERQNNSNRFEQMFKKSSSYISQKIPHAFSDAFKDFLASAFFHSQSLLQTSKHFHEKQNDILRRAQILRSDITKIHDLRNLPIRQLNFLADQEISKALIISSVQGGMSGTSSKLAMFCDLPALLLVNLKTVQEIAMCYGYDVSIPLEMECCLKVLQGALLPSPVKYERWNTLMTDTLKHEDEDVFAIWDSQFNGEDFYQSLFVQFSKLFILHALKNRLIGGVPIVGIAVGAKWNENLTKNVLEYTKAFYQYRLLSKRIKKEPTVL